MLSIGTPCKLVKAIYPTLGLLKNTKCNVVDIVYLPRKDGKKIDID